MKFPDVSLIVILTDSNATENMTHASGLADNYVVFLFLHILFVQRDIPKYGSQLLCPDHHHHPTLFTRYFGGGIFDEPNYVYKVCGKSLPKDEIPDNATTVGFRNNHIKNSEPIQTVIKRVHNRSQERSMQAAECVTIDKEEYKEIKIQLQKTPLYQQDLHLEWGLNENGLYVQRSNTIVRIEISRGELG